MSTMDREPELLYPQLADFYTSWRDIAYAAVRVVVGFILFMHGWPKVTVMGVSGVSAYMAKNGLEPGVLFALAAMFFEIVGGICLMLGLFTRFFAAALAIEILIAMIVVHLPNGFGIRANGYEFVLLIGIVLFSIAIRGGGPYSIDRMIGKEL